MSNATTVNLTNGVPTGPSGAATVSTLDNLIGAAGSPSAQVLTVQGAGGATALPVNAASGALVDGAIATIGAKADSAVTSPTSSASVIAALKGLMSALGSASGGAAATASKLVGGIYNTSYPSLGNGQQVALQLDASGGLAITGSRPFGVAATASNGQTTYSPSSNDLDIGGLVSISTGLPGATWITALTVRLRLEGSSVTTAPSNLSCAVFNASPASSTFTDGSAWSLASGDLAKLVYANAAAASISAGAIGAYLYLFSVTGRIQTDGSGRIYLALGTGTNMVFSATGQTLSVLVDGTY